MPRHQKLTSQAAFQAGLLLPCPALPVFWARAASPAGSAPEPGDTPRRQHHFLLSGCLRHLRLPGPATAALAPKPLPGRAKLHTSCSLFNRQARQQSRCYSRISNHGSPGWTASPREPTGVWSVPWSPVQTARPREHPWDPDSAPEPRTDREADGPLPAPRVGSGQPPRPVRPCPRYSEQSEA